MSKDDKIRAIVKELRELAKDMPAPIIPTRDYRTREENDNYIFHRVDFDALEKKTLGKWIAYHDDLHATLRSNGFALAFQVHDFCEWEIPDGQLLKFKEIEKQVFERHFGPIDHLISECRPPQEPSMMFYLSRHDKSKWRTLYSPLPGFEPNKLLNLTPTDARALMEQFWDKWPKIKEWKDNWSGLTQSMMNRRMIPLSVIRGAVDSDTEMRPQYDKIQDPDILEMFNAINKTADAVQSNKIHVGVDWSTEYLNEQRKFAEKCRIEQMPLGRVPIGQKAAVLTGKIRNTDIERWETFHVLKHEGGKAHGHNAFGKDCSFPLDTPAAPPRHK